MRAPRRTASSTLETLRLALRCLQPCRDILHSPTSPGWGRFGRFCAVLRTPRETTGQLLCVGVAATDNINGLVRPKIAAFGRKQRQEQSEYYLQGLLVQSEERRNAESLSKTVPVSVRSMQRFLTEARISLEKESPVEPPRFEVGSGLHIS